MDTPQIQSDIRRKEIGRERRKRTRDRLLKTAAQLLATRGEDATSIEIVISEAGLSRGTFYNYWATREELIEDLWDSVGRDPFSILQNKLSEIEDPAERICFMAREAIQKAAVDPVWGWLVIAIADKNPPEAHQLYAFPKDDLRLGMESKRFVIDDIIAARDLVVGATLSGIKYALRSGNMDTYPEALTKHILLSLGLSLQEAEKIAKQRYLDFNQP